MKRGHVVGTKKERTGATDWYAALQEEACRQVEAEWAAQVAQAQQQEGSRNAVQ